MVVIIHHRSSSTSSSSSRRSNKQQKTTKRKTSNNNKNNNNKKKNDNDNDNDDNNKNNINQQPKTNNKPEQGLKKSISTNLYKLIFKINKSNLSDLSRPVGCLCEWRTMLGYCRHSDLLAWKPDAPSQARWMGSTRGVEYVMILPNVYVTYLCMCYRTALISS